MMSSQMGAKAVDLIVEREKGVMVGLKSGRLIYSPFEEAAKDEQPVDLFTYNLARSLSI
jgi:6-phosphofructokinase 1